MNGEVGLAGRAARHAGGRGVARRVLGRRRLDRAQRSRPHAHGPDGRGEMEARRGRLGGGRGRGRRGRDRCSCGRRTGAGHRSGVAGGRGVCDASAWASTSRALAVALAASLSAARPAAGTGAAGSPPCALAAAPGAAMPAGTAAVPTTRLPRNSSKRMSSSALVRSCSSRARAGPPGGPPWSRRPGCPQRPGADGRPWWAGGATSALVSTEGRGHGAAAAAHCAPRVGPAFTAAMRPPPAAIITGRGHLY